LQKKTRRNNLGAGTNESHPNHVVVMLFVVALLFMAVMVLK